MVAQGAGQKSHAQVKRHFDDFVQGGPAGAACGDESVRIKGQSHRQAHDQAAFFATPEATQNDRQKKEQFVDPMQFMQVGFVGVMQEGDEDQ